MTHYTNASRLIGTAGTIENAKTIEEAWERFLKAVAAVGFEFAIYLTAGSDNEAPPCSLSNLPEVPETSRTLFDPFLDHCCNSYEITRTGTEYLESHPYLTNAEQDFVRDVAKTTGFISGVGIPVKLKGSERYGGFNLGTRLPREEFEATHAANFETYRAYCLIAHRRFEELRRRSAGQMSARALSPREKQCITLLAAGLRTPRIAEALGVSEPAIHLYVRNARRKLDAKTREEAVAKALTQGVLDE